MKLAHLTDEELFEISLMKTRKGTATSEARRAQQILYTRNITHGGFGVGAAPAISSHLDQNRNIERKWRKQ